MYKYEMDPTRTVGATERTRDAGQTDGQTDGRTEWNQYTPPTTSLSRGYNRDKQVDHLNPINSLNAPYIMGRQLFLKIHKLSRGLFYAIRVLIYRKPKDIFMIFKVTQDWVGKVGFHLYMLCPWNLNSSGNIRILLGKVIYNMLLLKHGFILHGASSIMDLGWAASRAHKSIHYHGTTRTCLNNSINEEKSKTAYCILANMPFGVRYENYVLLAKTLAIRMRMDSK